MTTRRIDHVITAHSDLPEPILLRIKEFRLRVKAHDDNTKWFKGYTPDGAVLTPAIDHLEDCEHDVETDKLAVPARNGANRIVTDLFDQLRTWDIGVARANSEHADEILTLARLTLPAHTPPTPKGPHVAIEASVVTLVVPAYKGKGNCTWECRLTTDGGKTHAATVAYSHRKMVLKELALNQAYGVSWRTKTGKDSVASAWSDPINFVAP